MKRLFEMLSADRQGDDNNHVALGQDAVLRGEADRAAHGIGCGPVGSHASEGEPADASGGSYARFGAELPAVGAGTSATTASVKPGAGAASAAPLPCPTVRTVVTAASAASQRTHRHYPKKNFEILATPSSPRAP